MKISKRTMPSIPGGLLNKNFVYVNKDNTDVAATFAKARAACAVETKVLDALSAGLRIFSRPVTVRRPTFPVSMDVLS